MSVSGQTPPVAAALRRSPRRRSPVPLVAALLVLTCLVGIGALFGSRFFDATSNHAGTKPVQIQSLSPNAPIVQAPLTPAELADIMHLSGYMKYKALASLYVAHMTLDVELGQLIMVEYASGCETITCPGVTSYYDADLDTMVNQLHAGGVIMYEFQMQNFTQTK